MNAMQVPITMSESWKQGLRDCGPIAWDRVFAQWRQGEAWQAAWQQHWRERDFDSWEAWRSHYIMPMGPQKKEWRLYHIEEHAAIASFYGAPTHGWIKRYYNGAMTRPLRDIACDTSLWENSKVQDLRVHFPAVTMLTGVVADGRIVLLEGMHRACAVAQCVMRRESLPSTIIAIALAPHDGDLVPLGKGDIQQ